MRIGIDFDNTIVNYDALFHKVALEKKLIPSSLSISKIEVREYIRHAGKEEIWTELQGYVYGARMDEADIYEGVIDFIHQASVAGNHVYIISHKTQYPFIGQQYDLHCAAGKWVANHLLWKERQLVKNKNVYFELTKQDKIARIEKCQCDYFIDDLPEILLMKGFPVNTEKLLFDPNNFHSDTNLSVFNHWQQLKKYLSL